MSELKPPRYQVAKTFFAGPYLLDRTKNVQITLRDTPHMFSSREEAVKVANAFGGALQESPNMDDQVLTRVPTSMVKKGEVCVSRDGSLVIGCSHCGQTWSLTNHYLDHELKIQPSIICETCTAHYWARLDPEKHKLVLTIEDLETPND